MPVHHWSKSTGYSLSQTEKLFLWIEGPTKSKNSMFYPNKWLISLDLVTLDQGWVWLNCFFLAANRSMLRGGLTLDSCCWCKLWKTSNDYQCSSPNQIHTKPVSLSVSLQSDWDNHKVKFWWDSYPRPALLHFSLKVQGIKGSTSQTQGSDGTLSATTLNSVKMILEGLTRLRTKVMELNPNFIQHLDVESLLTLFVENFFSSMRGGI